LERRENSFFLEDPEVLVINNKHLFPKQVVIMVNGNTASAAEMFTVMAKQNQKTKVVGERTNGACDYLEPQFYNLCNANFFIGVPWIKRTRIEYKGDIDNKGLLPDWLLDGEESIWINNVIDSLGKSKWAK
jgi:C-terminal processing protease CtpA/Prc